MVAECNLTHQLTYVPAVLSAVPPEIQMLIIFNMQRLFETS